LVGRDAGMWQRQIKTRVRIASVPEAKRDQIPSLTPVPTHAKGDRRLQKPLRSNRLKLSGPNLLAGSAPALPGGSVCGGSDWAAGWRSRGPSCSI